MIQNLRNVWPYIKINFTIFDFYPNLFQAKLRTNSKSLNKFSNKISIPFLSETEKQLCEEELKEKDIYESMVSFDNIKSPGNDGLTRVLSDIVARC